VAGTEQSKLEMGRDVGNGSQSANPHAGIQPALDDITRAADRTSNPATTALADIAAEAGLRSIHILAWRDLDDPEAGGSEVHANEVASRWAAAGIDVTMRTSYAPNRPTHGRRNGYRVIRKAGRYLVFPRAIASEMSGRMGPRDGLVEIWNGVPFLSPVWNRGPRMVWLHHVHGDMWNQIFGPTLAGIGRTLESRIAPPLYRSTPVVTLSPSSRDLIAESLGWKASRIHVVPPGIDERFRPGGDKSAHPLVAFVGRLVPVKRLDALVRVLIDVKHDVPDLEAVLVGEGYARPDLEEQIAAAGASDWLHLAGRLSDADLQALYRRAWAIASVSGHEGWGMTLTEAAACGTPSVVSDIAGHRDAVAHGRSGLLADGDSAVAATLTRVLTDDALRTQLTAGALERAGELTWDATAEGTLRVLAAEARRRR
jgi:glycosyltransferase involved in cell wall biosynthesis